MATKYRMHKFVFHFKLRGKNRQKTIYAKDGYDAGRELLRLFPKAKNLKEG